MLLTRAFNGWLLLAVLVISPQLAPAQSVRPGDTPPLTPYPARGPVVELSPFVISGQTETGWVATETLAGSRLRTDFRDVPNQIETLTRDFMQDLGLTTLDQALIYTANVENASDFVPATAGDQVSDPGLGGRVRGLGSGTLTRNFFKVFNPTDNFNLDRATIASGPNAILFGLGSPAGILDATPARALMRNRYGFELQYDSENSRRATFDANVVALPRLLSLRLMGLSKREYTEKGPNLDRDERLYGALTFKPLPHTTLVLQVEKDARNWNKAPRVTPTDMFTPWLNADKVPGSGYASPRPIYDNSTFPDLATNRIFVRASTAPVVIQGSDVGIRSWNNSVTVRSPGTMPGVDQTFDATGGFTVLDPKLFPFDVNIVGSARTVLLGGHTKTALLEHRLAPSLFLELGYHREDAINHKLSGGSTSGSYDYRLDVDANRYIPGTTLPNPYVGQLFYQGSAANTLQFHDRNDWRATLSYELDLARQLQPRGPWTRWLGRHRLSGLYTGGTSNDREQQQFERRILDDPVITGVALRARTFSGWANDASRVPQFRHYFGNPYDPKTAAGSMTGDLSLTDANGHPYTLYLADTPLRSTDGKRLAAGQVASGSLKQSTARILAWQGFFLPDSERHDRLVLTYGYRKDTARSATFDAPSTTQDFSGLFPVLWDARYAGYGPSQSGINRNLGVVLRPVRVVSLFYNKSTSFDLNIGRYDPFGNEIPGAGGSGRDYGVRFDLAAERVSVRLNRYDNALGPQRASNQINQFRDIFYNLEQRVLALDPTLPTINVNDGNKRGFRTAGRPNYYIMSDFTSTGYEAEVNLTPTSRWNIRLNGSKSEAVESNIGGPWYAWHAARLPVWKGVVARNGETDAQGRPVTWNTAPYSAAAPTGQTLEQYYSSALLGQAFAFMSAADGRATSTARGARANAIANYRFGEGTLKGVNLGGAVRWRSAPTIGYGVKTTATGTVVLDLDRSYLGREETYLDLMAGYRGKFRPFGGGTYRLQVNIRNALDANRPVPISALTTGAVSRIATVDSRVIVVTFGAEL